MLENEPIGDASGNADGTTQQQNSQPTELSGATEAPSKKPRQTRRRGAASRPAGPPPAEAEQEAALGATAVTEPSDAGEPARGEDDAARPPLPSVTFQPPTAVVFRSPEPVDIPAPPQDTEPADAPEYDDADGPDDGDDEDRPSRRRRRRGGRGRGKAKQAAPSSGEEGAASTDGDDEPGEAAGDDAERDGQAEADDTAAGEAEADGGDAPQTGSSSRRRRRRRRRVGSPDTDQEAPDDPPNTVVRVREPRSDKPEDDIQAVKGSTRLEAKRQRRREGRELGRRRPPVITESEFLARRESVRRVMVIRQTGDRTQIAVLEDDILVEHYVDRANHQSYVGNVYLGKVQNVLPSMEAAFVDIGKGRNAVLYAGEVNWDASGLEGQPKRIESALKSGQSVLVQVTKDPVGHKGARLTSQVSLPGRYLVYVPNSSMTGISRKLPDKERSRLKQVLKKIMPEDAGVIVRTAAEGASEEELSRDIARLAAQWETIQRKAKTASAPSLLYSEPDLTIRVVRDIFNEDFSELVVSGDAAWSMVDEYVRYVAPHLADRIRKWVEPQDVFAAYRIDEQIQKALDRKVWLPSGGSLVIDRTEAMTVIDVNTGKFTGQGGNLEETVTRNNLEAAEEIVRQLRLRDIGGIIVVDFIDMVLESNRELVLRRLLECLARDRTKHQVAEVTSLGLVQMTRKRVGQGLLEAFSEPCECCNGRGVIMQTELVEAKPAAKQAERSNAGRRRRKGGQPEEPAAVEPAAAAVTAGDGAAGGKTPAAGETVPVGGPAAGNGTVPAAAAEVGDELESTAEAAADAAAAAAEPASALLEDVDAEPLRTPRTRKTASRRASRPAGPAGEGPTAPEAAPRRGADAVGPGVEDTERRGRRRIRLSRAAVED